MTLTSDFKTGSLYEFDYSRRKTGPTRRKVLITEKHNNLLHGWDFNADDVPYWRNFNVQHIDNVENQSDYMVKVPSSIEEKLHSNKIATIHVNGDTFAKCK